MDPTVPGLAAPVVPVPGRPDVHSDDTGSLSTPNPLTTQALELVPPGMTPSPTRTMRPLPGLANPPRRGVAVDAQLPGDRRRRADHIETGQGLLTQPSQLGPPLTTTYNGHGRCNSSGSRCCSDR
ncbi:hypothetical protein GCM10009629_57960 [Pseudonocardia alni]